MMAPGIEWSATGRHGASLAGLGGGSFARAALPRCLSRLTQMASAAWLRESPPGSAGRSAEAMALGEALLNS
jgi:hypothetical protein